MSTHDKGMDLDIGSAVLEHARMTNAELNCVIIGTTGPASEHHLEAAEHQHRPKLETSRNEDLVMFEVCCSIYRSWLSQILRKGGPDFLDGTAWHSVLSHWRLCPSCAADEQFGSDIRSTLDIMNPEQRQMGQRPSVEAVRNGHHAVGSIS
jgi:hypothetical protein